MHLGLVEEDVVGVLLAADLGHQFIAEYLLIGRLIRLLLAGWWLAKQGWLRLDRWRFLLETFFILLQRRLRADLVDLYLRGRGLVAGGVH